MTGEVKRIKIGALLDRGAILEIQDGNHGELHPKATDYVEDGIPFVMANDLVNNRVDVLRTQKIPLSMAEKLRIGFAQAGDVLLTHKGTIGSTAIVESADPYWMLTPQVTYYRTDSGKLNNWYLMYAFQEPVFQKTIKSRADQATRPYIGITAQRTLEVLYCPIDEQVGIVKILRPYDEMINNSRRRIELLEQSARLLFKEWFGRLRYPGHEHDKIVDGVPDGWERKALGELIALHYGKALQEERREPGEIDVYGSSGEVGKHNVKFVDGPGIVVGRKGNIGSIFWVDEAFWPIDTVFYVEPEKVSLFILHLLQAQTFQNSDAAVPGLNRGDAYSKKIIWPRKALREEFESFAKTIFAQRKLLLKSNVKLTTARDLLLPRLMDGRIPV